MVNNKLIQSKCGKINLIEGIAVDDIKAIILNIHGIGSHFQFVYDSLDEFVNRDAYFSNMNYKSFAFEFHGHGKSDGLRCCINDFNDLVSDLICVIKYINTLYKDLKIFLLAESMGGAVVFKYIIDNINNIDEIFAPSGIILLSPLCGIDDNFKPPELILNILLSFSYYLPNLKLVINDSNTSLDSSVNTKYLINKMKCNNTYKPPYMLCTMREIYNVSLWISENISKIKIPILIFYGLRDKIIPFDCIKKTFEKIKSSDKELVILPETQHCILVPNTNDDLTPHFVYIKILNWMNNKLLSYNNLKIKSNIEQIVEPIVESNIESIVEPIVKSNIEPIVEPIVKSNIEPIVELKVESNIEPIVELKVKSKSITISELKLINKIKTNKSTNSRIKSRTNNKTKINNYIRIKINE